MQGNICYQCMEKVHTTQGMRAVIDWGTCEVCGLTGVFYARQDEIELANKLLNSNSI